MKFTHPFDRCLKDQVNLEETRIVGLIFDGSIEAWWGRYVYDETKNRAVAVHTGASGRAAPVYDAGTLADEVDPLRATRP